MKKLRYILPPEASDGQNKTVVDTAEDALVAVARWLSHSVSGETFKIETRDMTDEEVNALPLI